MKAEDFDDDWFSRQQQARPSATTRSKTKPKTEPFVKMPLWWAEAAAKATRSPATLVLVELLWAHWKAKSLTFPLPNVRLRKQGTSRKVKRRVLRDLERVGLITVERPECKSPIVTLVL
jgi:hypothetical protein